MNARLGHSSPAVPRAAAETRLRSALWLPLFDDLADPLVVARVAADAEAAGWDGVFVWDQLCWPGVCQVADPWLILTVIATATERVRFGPMVTPLPRRRPAKLARETATLDRLGDGRLTLGIGSDRFARELSRTGEQVDDRSRGDMLDEALEILASAWSGEPVRHRGPHYTVDDMRFLPRPAQRPGVPVWAAGMPGNVKPLRRAARLDGFFPANLDHPDQLAEAVATITELRQQDKTYDFAVGLPVGVDSRRQEWHVAIQQALTDEPGGPALAAEHAAAFSLADPATVDAILTSAGFVDVRLVEVREPVYYGADGASALHAVQSLGMTERLLRDLDDTSADRALSRLRTILDARDDGGVWFDSCAWLVTARRR